MIIDAKNKFVFISVAKTACTSIRRRLSSNKDPIPSIYHMFLKDVVKNYPEVQNFYKFAFVRNPYDRLVSAYYDFRYNLSHKSWSYPIYKYDVFKDFVMDFENSPCIEFIHLQPQFDYLEIDGKINVDFIGRFENLREDFKKVEETLNLLHIDLPITRTSKHPDYRLLYDEESKNVVRRIYKNDIEAFDYEF